MNSNYKNTALFILLSFFLLPEVKAQQSALDTVDISKLPLEELMKNNSKAIPSMMDEKIASAVEVATAKPMALRRSPAILSLITAEEIERSGARDLMDILNTVPGFDFGLDVEGVVGIGVRGNWANEGKVLLLFDGQELNETVYGTLQFGNSFPVENIKRIEVIRGPGSAIYGGTAEYAVINIITRTENDWKGVNIEASHGRFKNSSSRSTLSLSAAQKIKKSGVNFNGFISDGKRSDRMYSDIFGNSYDMTNYSSLKKIILNLGYNYENLSLKAIYFNNLVETRDGFEKVHGSSYFEYFKSYHVEAKYNLKFSEQLTITPKISFKRNSPWEVKPEDNYDPSEAEEVVYQTVADRYKVNVTSFWDAAKNLNVTGGIEGFYDYARKFDGDVFRNSDKSQLQYFNAAVFCQSVYKTKIASFILGARYDYNNSFGDAFIPRLGLTKRFDRFNFKLLYSQSFKAPSIENVETSLLNKILPERTTIWEFEAGCQLSKNMFLTVNLFDITTKNTIIYFVDTSSNVEGVPDGYFNAEKSGSRGAEVEFKMIENWGTINLSYSYYTNRDKGSVESYISPSDNFQSLGLGKNKLSISASFNVTKDFYVSPSFIYKSSKYGITGITDDERFLYSRFPDTYMANLVIGKNNLFVPRLKVSTGIYNIFNQQIDYVQPYASGHAPLPGATREVSVKCSYSF